MINFLNLTAMLQTRGGLREKWREKKTCFIYLIMHLIKAKEDYFNQGTVDFSNTGCFLDLQIN